MSETSRSDRASLDDLCAAEEAAIFLIKKYHFIRGRLADKRMADHAYRSPESRVSIVDWLLDFAMQNATAVAKIERVQTEIRATRDDPFSFEDHHQGDFPSAHEAASHLGDMTLSYVKFGVFKSLEPDEVRALGRRIDDLDRDVIIQGFDGILEIFGDGSWPWPKAREVESVIKIEAAKAVVERQRASPHDESFDDLLASEVASTSSDQGKAKQTIHDWCSRMETLGGEMEAALALQAARPQPPAEASRLMSDWCSRFESLMVEVEVENELLGAALIDKLPAMPSAAPTAIPSLEQTDLRGFALRSERSSLRLQELLHRREQLLDANTEQVQVRARMYAETIKRRLRHLSADIALMPDEQIGEEGPAMPAADTVRPNKEPPTTIEDWRQRVETLNDEIETESMLIHSPEKKTDWMRWNKLLDEWGVAVNMLLFHLEAGIAIGGPASDSNENNLAAQVAAMLPLLEQIVAKVEREPAPVNDDDGGSPRNNGGKKTKKSTQRGEGRAKLIGALTAHHKYADGGCLNLEPIGSNELARAAGVSPSTASAFFDKEFLPKGDDGSGHARYKALCRNSGKLADALKALNDEFSPHDLFGRTPPGEQDREGE